MKYDAGEENFRWLDMLCASNVIGSAALLPKPTSKSSIPNVATAAAKTADLRRPYVKRIPVRAKSSILRLHSRVLGEWKDGLLRKVRGQESQVISRAQTLFWRP